MADVFISYVEEDADVVELLAAGLTETGYSCWHYRRDSTPGTSYLAQITDAISRAKVVLLVLSPQTLDSFQVDKEINFAHECNKPFLPITRDLAWGEFQQRRPTWRMAIGTTVAIPIPTEGVPALLPRLITGLHTIGLPPAAGTGAGSPANATANAIGLTQARPSVPARPPLIDSVTPPGALPNRAALVGRVEELRFFREQYDAIAAGRGGRLILISGEPGVGKTRLAQELGLYAWGKGALYLEGTYLRDGTAPYGAWVDALQTGLRELPDDALAPLLGSYGTELGQLFPELATRSGVSTSATATPPEEQRRRLFNGLAELVGLVSRRVPLVLVLNDLQWAPGLAVLLHVARRLGETRALVIGTYRDQEFKEQPALVHDWAELNRARLATQLSLRAFTQEESEQLITAYFGAETAKQLRDVLFRQTRGNAFFLEESLRSLAESGAVRASATGWELVASVHLSVPESVRLVGTERVERLGPTGRELLTQAAVLGQEFSLPVLQALSGRAEDEVVDVIERAVSARLLVDRSVAREERFAFADDQVQEVLYAAISALRRRRAHLRAAQIIEQRYANELDKHVEELALHFLEGNDLGKALDYSLAAGWRAYALASWERAVQHFETAREVLREFPDELSRLAQVLDRLAVLDVLFARVGTVHAEEALELYTRLGDWLRAGRMHRLLGMTFTTGLAGVADMERAHYHNESALRLFEAASDSGQKALIYSAVASSLLFGRLDTAGGFRHARQALTIAEQLGDPDQITHACIYLAAAAIHSGDTDQAEALAERSWAAAQEGRDPWGKVAAAYYPVLNWPWLNDRAWLARWRERYLARRQSSHVEFFDLPSLGPSALELALLGRPRDALAELQVAAESGVQRPSFVSYLRYYAAAAHAILGNWEQAQSLFRQSLDAVETGHYLAMRAEVGAFYGQALLAEGDLLAAEELLTSAYSVAQERGSLIQELRLLPLLVDLHLDQQHRAQAEAALTRAWEILERSRHWYGLEAAVHRAAGRLELARANWAEAGYAFERALELEHARGFPYQEAHILVHWAELYRQRLEPGDAARRQELLDQALVIFERCEAKADIERVRALRAAFVDQ